MRYQLLEEVKNIIKKYYHDADCGIFNCHNIAGDTLETIYYNFEDSITIDICYYWGYFEIFGLTCDEWEFIENFYYSL